MLIATDRLDHYWADELGCEVGCLYSGEVTLCAPPHREGPRWMGWMVPLECIVPDFTFPLGVYALATLKLAAWLQLGFFTVMGHVLVVALAGLWLVVASRTLAGAWRGELFVSPCIAGCTGK